MTLQVTARPLPVRRLVPCVLLALSGLLVSCSIPLAEEFNDSFDLSASAGTTGESYRIRAYAPGSLQPSAGAPVLFALDGDVEHDTVVAALRTAWREGAIDGVLLISIGYGRDLVTVTRLRELDYTPSVPAQPDGRVDRFWQFILSELKPEIEQRYFAGAPLDPVKTAVAGHSLGGLAALYGLLDNGIRSQVRGFIALSPSLWYGNLVSFSYEAALAAGLPAPAEKAALYAAWGGSEPKALTLPAAAMMEKLGAPSRADLSLLHEVFPWAEHYDTIMPGYAAAVRFLFPKGGR